MLKFVTFSAMEVNADMAAMWCGRILPYDLKVGVQAITHMIVEPVLSAGEMEQIVSRGSRPGPSDHERE